MTIKIDIEKAFDYMAKAFDYMEFLVDSYGMHRISFQMDQLDKRMHIHYLFLMVINGESCGWFNPSIGLRQGDPLSPFLFMIWNEVLSRLITTEKQLGNIQGINISKNGPYLSHLFFANNLILDGTTSICNANSFLNCLDNYSSWSGQKINKDKIFHSI